ncbi:Common plant regulatory factor 1 [Platanthera zijinensis]|uniref:Common plant regulatory factor 1 n=1 Tax=Platanthera zijinensis TaxID=2320716 RepID=A0AAP0BH97_9ASPA
MPMGSPEETTTPAKPPNSSKSFPSVAPPPLPPEVLTASSYSAEWAASVQAFYGGGAAVPHGFFPPVWGGQHLMSPYATPIAYSPMYAPGAVYAHPSMTQGMSYPNAELGEVKSKGAVLKFGEGGKGASVSGDDESSHSGDSGTDGSSDTGNESTEVQENSKKRSRGDAFQEGQSSHSASLTQKKRAPKLPVSAPGRTALPDPTTNLNIGMGIWNPPHHGASPLKVRPARDNATVVDHNWVQDDRELKRERRKQSNRESARRSRLRKQQECDDLARKVSELNGENNALRMELEQLHKVCKDLEAENQHIVEELRSIRGDSEPTSR